MTVLNYSYVVNFSRQKLWPLVAGFSQDRRYWEWIEKVECLSGKPQELGSVWRFHIITRAGLWQLEMEITEWLEGERLALTPLGYSGVFEDIRLFQIVIDLGEKSDRRTQIKISCEYEPLNKWAKLKNLTFQRQRFLDLIVKSVDALSRAAAAEA